MDISKIVNEIVEKLKGNPTLLKNFKNNPIQTLEDLSGIDLPDGGVDALVAAVKVKLGDGDDGISSALGALGGLFKK